MRLTGASIHATGFIDHKPSSYIYIDKHQEGPDMVLEPALAENGRIHARSAKIGGRPEPFIRI